MIEELKKQDAAAYEHFVQSHSKGHFGQSLAWAKQKQNWKHTVLVSRGTDGAIRGGMLILFRSIGGLTLAYSCRGPVCSVDDTETLQELLGAAEQLCRERRAVALRIDPDVPAAEQAYLRALLELGFCPGEGGGALDQTQAKFVFRLPLAGRSEEEVLKMMHAKTRYNVRLSQKNGVKVRICGPEMIPVFAKIMQETGKRDGFTVRKSDYFSSLLEHFGDDIRLYMAFYEEKPIAGAIALSYGDKTWYLYGASSAEKREKMPNYLLQWEMIRWAIERKSRLYDFRGVPGNVPSDHPLYGLYRFKRGFGGDFTEFIGEMNLILSQPGYRLLQLLLRCYGAYKKLRIQLDPSAKKRG